MPTPTIGLPPTRTNNAIDRALAAIHARLDALEQGGGGGGSVEVTSQNFTPQAFGSSGAYTMASSDNFGQATRIGDIVIAQGKFTVEDAGTASGAFILGGFPDAPYFDDALNDLSPDDDSALWGLFAFAQPENGWELTAVTADGITSVLRAGSVPIITVAFPRHAVAAEATPGYTDIGGGLFVGAAIGLQAEANAGDSGGTVSASNAADLGMFGTTFRFCLIYRAAAAE